MARRGVSRQADGIVLSMPGNSQGWVGWKTRVYHAFRAAALVRVRGHKSNRGTKAT